MQSRVASAPSVSTCQSQKICMTEPDSATVSNHAVVVSARISLHDKAVLPVSPARLWQRNRPGDARRFLGHVINPT